MKLQLFHWKILRIVGNQRETVMNSNRSNDGVADAESLALLAVVTLKQAS
jgi:hypothetical protein